MKMKAIWGFIFFFLCSGNFFGALASKGQQNETVPLFSPAEKRELKRLKGPQQLVISYRKKLKKSADRRFEDFLSSTSQQVQLSLARRWKNPVGYWENVDRAMLHYYFRKWLRREWYQLEREEMDFLEEE